MLKDRFGYVYDGQESVESQVAMRLVQTADEDVKRHHEAAASVDSPDYEHDEDKVVQLTMIAIVGKMQTDPDWAQMRSFTFMGGWDSEEYQLDIGE